MKDTLTLKTLGWTEHEQQHLEAHPQHLIPARISRIDRGMITTLSTQHERRAILRRTTPPLAVGDWVLLQEQPTGDPVVEALLPRRSLIDRAAVGNATQQQLIAANVDTLFIVTSMNSEFSPSRLERYLIAAWDAGTSPVIIMTKADLAADPDEYLRRAQRVAQGVPIIAIAAHAPGAMDALNPYLLPQKTCALIGSSGVGKSTLINKLFNTGFTIQPTQQTRDSDETGKHTTTSRHLFVLNHDRGLIIDTPGMRELSLWSGQGTVSHAFDDIERLAQQCRFRDCTHHEEPGCAIWEAIEQGQLMERRFNNYNKLQRELKYQETRQDEAARRQEYRQRGRLYREVQKHSKKR